MLWVMIVFFSVIIGLFVVLVVVMFLDRVNRVI